MPTPDRKTITDTMRTDAEKASLKTKVIGTGYTSDDVDKLYDHYGPYASKLFDIAMHESITFNAALNNSMQDMGEAYSHTTAIDKLFDSVQEGKTPLTCAQISRIVNKPELEVAGNINEYKKQQEMRKQIDNTYTTICNGQNKPSTSVESLLAAGVTPEDFQAVFEQDKTLAFNIGNSPSNNAFVDAAKNKNLGSAQGKCGIGTQAVCDSIPGNPTARALHTQTPRYALDEGIAAGGASGYYARLEQSGKYITLKMDNKAFVDTTNVSNKYTYIMQNRLTEQNKKNIQQMKEFTDQLPRGTIITWDNHTTKASNGSVSPLQVPQKTPGQGIQYGHVTVKITDPHQGTQYYKCDGLQENPHATGWYGKNIHMCYNIDCQVPADYAKLLIAQAQERTGQCLDVEENRKAYEAGRTASQTASNIRNRRTVQSAPRQASPTRTSNQNRRRSTTPARRRNRGR